MNKFISYLLTIIVTAVIFGGGVYFWQQQQIDTTDNQSQRKVNAEPTTFSEGTSEYRSSSGMKFQYPLNRGANQSYDLITVQEDQKGNIMLCSKTQPELCQAILLYRKNPTTKIEEAIKTAYKTSIEQGCNVSAQEIESSPTGLLKFKIAGEASPEVPVFDLPIICAGGRFVAYYNSEHPDLFVIIGVVQDSIFDLSIIEDSLEIE